MPTLAEAVEVWLPVGQAPVVLGRDVSQEPTFRAFPALARVGVGVTPARLREELATMSQRIAEAFPGTSQGWTWAAEPVVESVTRDLRGPIRSLSVGALLLLAVGISNVLGLFAQRARDTCRRRFHPGRPRRHPARPQARRHRRSSGPDLDRDPGRAGRGSVGSCLPPAMDPLPASASRRRCHGRNGGSFERGTGAVRGLGHRRPHGSVVVASIPRGVRCADPPTEIAVAGRRPIAVLGVQVALAAVLSVAAVSHTVQHRQTHGHESWGAVGPAAYGQG